ncbi:GATOR1 complex protein DEPDC5-like [Montipora capricornis]|uniref:GATOR1 complex protein DEPDC5-like n=1 Tax=Montipora capricornis TaxID=246305 RepID=UPI0035F17F68
MKLFKLWVHQQNFSEDELIINPKEFPYENVGDILEIHHPDEGNTRLLLQIKSISPDFQQKDTISIEQSVANIFQLRTYWDVEVTKVEPKDVSVNMVEVLLKDQFVARSEMWRFSKDLVGSCVYVNKKLKHSGVRAQVNEIWCKGEKVSCGVISKDTRVIFRSCSSKLYLFIQMSKEMWDFDFNGDLFFEKAINGFLYELFTKWKDLNVNHDVSIILFSRTFYDAPSLGDFPPDAVASIQKDPYGRFYEDFYQVVALNERRDDWIPVLVTLKQCFNQYPSLTNCCDISKCGNIIGRNSNSLDGNFLEAINLSLNAFERHHIDRNFERTGQTVIVVAPGSGVFEVDRELTSITKQRLLDSGVSIDLVCLAEQPLHTVPLLKYFSKVLGQRDANLADDYNIPHWMNHNFYASPKTRNKVDNYVPRIKVPEIVLNSLRRRPEGGKGSYSCFTQHFESVGSSSQLPDLVDYDEYDAKVFRNSSSYSTVQGFHPQGSGFRRIRSAMDVPCLAKSMSRDDLMLRRKSSPPRGACSFEDFETNSSSLNASLRGDSHSMKDVYNRKHIMSSSVECTSHGVFASLSGNVLRNTSQHCIIRPIPQHFGVVSAGANPSLALPMGPVCLQRTLINPFKPNEIPCNWSCNRQRWSHAFPTGPDGEILHRHYHKLASDDNEIQEKPEKSRNVEEAALAVVAARKREMSEASHSISEDQELFEEPGTSGGSDDTDEDTTFPLEDPLQVYQGYFSPAHRGGQTSQQTTPRRRTLPRINLYRKVDVSVEHDWTAAVKTSVDWKSLTCPALLPLTTDYMPSKKTLDSNYEESNYTLPIDEVDFRDERKNSNSDWGEHESIQEGDARGACRLLSAEMILTELVSQRIRKGFQLIVPKEKGGPNEKRQSIAAIPVKSDDQEFFLSIGQIFHKLTLTSPQVIKYKPRHLQVTKRRKNYSYRLWIPQRRVFEPNESEFCHEEMESYNWNYLDQYICADPEFDELIESLNYWKARFLLLPFSQRKLSQGEKKNMPVSPEGNLMEGFLKFLEVMNRLKRFQSQKTLQTPKERRQSEPCYPSRRHWKQFETKATSALPSDLTVIKENSLLPGTPLSARSRSSSSAGPEPSSFDSCASPSRELSSELSNGCEESSGAFYKDRLSLQSPLETVAEAMMETGSGLSFLPEIKGLKPFSFLSVEAIAWITQHVDGVVTKEKAIQLCLKMTESGIIQHASENAKQKMVEGFIIFCFTPRTSWTQKPEDLVEAFKFPVPHRSSIDVERFEFDLLQAFQSEWFEVALWPRRIEEDFPEFLAPDHMIQSFPTRSLNWKRSASKSAWRNSASLHSENGCNCVPAYKFVTLDADHHQKSQRPEACSVRYHGNFCPLHAFEMELHWIAATGGIVNDMVQSWTRKAPSCGFHIVPVPVSPFPDPYGRNVDPFRLPVFIPLNLGNCSSNGSTLFQEFDPASRHFRMFVFQEAILQRFGFIRDSPYGSMHMNSPMVSMTPVQCRENDYVHTSGVAFVRIPHWEEDMDPVGCRVTRSEGKGRCMGFQWMPNFMLTKRWRSAATGDQGASSKLRNEFEDFCADKNGSLEAFWESCKESARKAAGSRTEVERTIVSDKETEKAEQNREGAISDSLEIERPEGSD